MSHNNIGNMGSIEKLIDENNRLRKENKELKNKLGEYNALLETNVTFKKHIIQLRYKIKDLTAKLDEREDPVSD